MAKKNKQLQLNWDLSPLYKSINDPQIEKDIADLNAAVLRIEKKHKGKVVKYNKKQLLALFKELDRFREKQYDLMVYPELLFSLNSADQKIQDLLQRVDLQGTEMASHTHFISLELAKRTDLQQLMKDPAVAPYNIFFESAYQYRKHYLTEPEEEVINRKNLTSIFGWQKMYSQISSQATVKFNGKDVTEKDLINAMRAPKQKDRAAAAKAFSELLGNNIQNYSHIYNMIVLDKMQEDKMRKHAYPEEARHIGNGVTKKAVEAMKGAVVEQADLAVRYYKIKKKLLGLKNFTYYDRYAEIALKNLKPQKYNYAQAVEIVRKAFANFDPEFEKIFLDLVNTGHVDVLPKKGKRGGAFCMYMRKEVKPYILLNHYGSANDVQTLAHEMGHAIHDMLATSVQPITLAHAPLTLAEVASTFGEQIIFEDLLAKAKTKEEKIVLLAERIDDILNTVIRQVIFFIFEQKAHNFVKEHGTVNTDQLDSQWMETQKVMFGNFVKLDENYKHWWSYISHFFASPFYVYAYAMANMLVFGIYDQYKKGQPGFNEKYKEFLALGGTKNTMDAAKVFGFDLEDKRFWQGGMNVLKELIEQLESLC